MNKKIHDDPGTRFRKHKGVLIRKDPVPKKKNKWNTLGTGIVYRLLLHSSNPSRTHSPKDFLNQFVRAKSMSAMEKREFKIKPLKVWVTVIFCYTCRVSENSVSGQALFKAFARMKRAPTFSLHCGYLHTL
jgi:hypothetical protein